MPKLKTKQTNREDFVAELAKRSGLTIKKTDEFVLEFMKLVHEMLDSGIAVVFRPYGKFYRKTRAAKTGKDPHGGRYSAKGKLVVAWEPFCKGKKECETGPQQTVGRDGQNGNDAPPSGSDQ